MRLSKRGYLEPNDRDDREALAAAVNACFYDAPTCDPFLRIYGLDATRPDPGGIPIPRHPAARITGQPKLHQDCDALPELL
jgi:hypothetical protein